MATHSRVLAWRIPWIEPGGLQSMGLQKSQTRLSTQLRGASILCLQIPSFLRAHWLTIHGGCKG